MLRGVVIIDFNTESRKFGDMSADPSLGAVNSSNEGMGL